MGALLNKDWMIIKSTHWFVFIVFYLFLGIQSNYTNSLFIPIIPIFTMYYFIVNLHIYDYKYDAIVFSLSFPIDKRDWVKSRYLISLLICIVAFAFLLLIDFVHLLGGTFSGHIQLDMMVLLIGSSMSLIFASFMLFGYFRMGYQKMRLFNFIFLACFCAISNILIRSIDEFGYSLLYVFVLIVMPIITFFGSYYLSLKSVKNIKL